MKTFPKSTEQIQDLVAALLVAGTGVTLAYNDGDGTLTISASGGGGGGDALTTNPLSQFAATTSAQLRGVISDETGSGALVFATSPTLVTPLLGTPTSGTLTNCTGYPYANLSGTPSTFAPSSHNHAGTEITSGTIPDARLSSNVPLKNAANTFAAIQNITTGLVVGSSSSGGLGGYVPSAHLSQFVASGTVVPLTVAGGAGAIQLWNDQGPNPARAVAFGYTSINTSTVTPITDFAISNFSNGIVVWTERFRIYSATGNVSLGHTGPSPTDNGAKLQVTGDATISGWIDAKHRPYTFAGLPLASAAQDKTFACTDSTLAMNGTNYGTTPGGGGANRVKVFSNGTAWLLA